MIDQTDEFLIQEVVNRILDVCRPKRIILFGSAVTGTMGPESDIDFIVIEDDDPNEKTLIVREACGGLSRPVDVVVLPTVVFDACKEAEGHIEFAADKRGRIVYDAP